MLGFISFVKNIMCIKIYKTKNDAATYYLKKYKSFKYVKVERNKK